MQHKGLDQGREVHGWWSGVPLISEISEKQIIALSPHIKPGGSGLLIEVPPPRHERLSPMQKMLASGRGSGEPFFKRQFIREMSQQRGRKKS
jgi:hypothetical protein